MKKLLSILLVLLSIIVSGCGEESSAIEELKKTTSENLKLAQVARNKTHNEIGRQLLKNAYLNYCKTHKFQSDYAKGEKELIDEVNKLKGKAVLNMVEAGSKNIFDMPKAEGVKELQEAAQKVKDYQNKHKEYIDALTAYRRSFHEVSTNSLKDGNYYFVNANTNSIGANLALKNNFDEKIDFDKLDLYGLRVIELRPGADRAIAEDMERHKHMSIPGKVIDARASLVKDPKQGGVIRTLPVGERIEVIDDVSEGPNIKIRVVSTGEEGWVWHKYIRYGDESDIRKSDIDSSVKSTNAQQPYVVNSAPQVRKQKMFNPVDTPQSFAIMKGIVGVSSSSALKEGDKVYSASNIVDKNNHTCWADGVSGLGIGESITINFDQKYNISGFRIFNGYQKSEDLFYKNSRPTAFRVIGSDGSNVVYNLEDSIYEQDIYFDKMINVNSIKLVIEKVQRGNKYEDTCISEIDFF